MFCAVFSCMGLGDGLLALILSNNLTRAGHQVTTYHPFLQELQSWFPTLPILPFPKSEIPLYDHYYIVYENTPWMRAILDHCLKNFRDRTTVLNPIATPHRDYPYWEEGRFDGNQPFADNLLVFCRDLLKLPDPTKENGIQPPSDLDYHSKRVVIHPTSSRAGKNWTRQKFLALARRLEEDGFEPAFILTEKERLEWPDVEAPLLPSLRNLARFVAESGYMIGNDSGIGHLASCLNLPTLIICRSKLTANFWRPGWKKGEVLYPPCWIPNLKKMRWRDKHWQKFISVNRVHSAFQALQISQQVSESLRD